MRLEEALVRMIAIDQCLDLTIYTLEYHLKTLIRILYTHIEGEREYNESN
jgi:hypothetical protein